MVGLRFEDAALSFLFVDSDTRLENLMKLYVNFLRNLFLLLICSVSNGKVANGSNWSYV